MYRRRRESATKEGAGWARDSRIDGHEDAKESSRESSEIHDGGEAA
jgi:hypothetical protein